MGVQAAADTLGVSVCTARRMMDDGRIEGAIHTPIGRVATREAVEAALERLQEEGNR
jgi:predicted site-specific integrase-resolvase